MCRGCVNVYVPVYNIGTDDTGYYNIAHANSSQCSECDFDGISAQKVHKEYFGNPGEFNEYLSQFIVQNFSIVISAQTQSECEPFWQIVLKRQQCRFFFLTNER